MISMLWSRVGWTPAAIKKERKKERKQCIRNGIQYDTITISIEADIQKLKDTELFGK